MEPVYPDGKINYLESGANLVIGVERFHPVPLDYIPFFYKKLAGLKGLKAQMEGVPSGLQGTERYFPDCIENTARAAMGSRLFEPLAMASPRGTSLAGLLVGYEMPVDILEVHLAARHFLARGAPQDPKTAVNIAEKILAWEKKGVFPYIDPARGANNYSRVSKELGNSGETAEKFCSGCGSFVREVWQYGIIAPDVAEFAGRVGEGIGVLVEQEHAMGVKQALEGKMPEKPQKWEVYISEDHGTMPLAFIECVIAVRSVIRSPEPKVNLGSRIARRLTGLIGR